MEKSDRRVLIICIVAALVLFFGGLTIGNFETIMIAYLGIAAMMIVIFPYSIIVYLKVKKEKVMDTLGRVQKFKDIMSKKKVTVKKKK